MSTLNLDVLREICDFLTSARDVMSFSRTGSTLRTFAVERRLNMRVNTIHLPKSLHNFYNFVFVDEALRGPHIRAIDIRMNMLGADFSEDVVDRFLALLAAATRLRTLTLHAPGHPRLLPAVAELTSLHELGIAASTDVAGTLLAGTRSALGIFRWQVDLNDNRPPGSPTIKIAPQLTLTLEELEVPSNFIAILSRSQVSLPAVRSLILVEGLGAVGQEGFHWRMDVLLAVFPNLDRTLIINTFVDDNDRLTALRGENREAQTQVRAWKKLDRVASESPHLLYALALTCPIRHLTLDAPYEESDITVVRAILEECTPTHLAITSITVPYNLTAPYWNSLFPDSTVAKLTHLVVDMTHYDSIMPREPFRNHWTDDDEMDGWDVILDSALSALDALGPRRLTHLRVCFHAAGDIPFRLQQRRNSRLVYDALRYFQFDRLLTALPTILPSLAYIFMTSSGVFNGNGRQQGWKVTRAWQVGRPSANTHPAEAVGGMHNLEELPPSETEAMLDREQMHRTRREPWGAESQSWVESDSDSDDD